MLCGLSHCTANDPKLFSSGFPQDWTIDLFMLSSLTPLIQRQNFSETPLNFMCKMCKLSWIRPLVLDGVSSSSFWLNRELYTESVHPSLNTDTQIFNAVRIGLTLLHLHSKVSPCIDFYQSNVHIQGLTFFIVISLMVFTRTTKILFLTSKSKII